MADSCQVTKGLDPPRTPLFHFIITAPWEAENEGSERARDLYKVNS